MLRDIGWPAIFILVILVIIGFALLIYYFGKSRGRLREIDKRRKNEDTKDSLDKPRNE